MGTLMLIDAFHSVNLNARLEREAMIEVTSGIASLFEVTTSRERIGLLVASDNAGSSTSVQFWADAVRTGPAVASPELFPWCLANAPCGSMARHFGVTGPNSTLLGEANALLAALETADDLFGRSVIDLAFVVAISFASPSQAGRAVALRLSSGEHTDQHRKINQIVQESQHLPLRALLDILAREGGPFCVPL
jgi:3-oxoacyl-(acyl-carrier-protein) synthase